MKRDCKLQTSNCKMRNGGILQFAICIQQFAFCNFRNRPARPRNRRPGGVYIAVLGTSLIVALLGMSALIGQRLQNRQLAAASDVRQAQLNAHTAVELAVLTMKQDANWRATAPNGTWFTNRSTGAGSCSVQVTDPTDANLANSPDDPIIVRGIGYNGQAVQQLEVTIDPRKAPLGCLRSAIAAGDMINLQNDTLRSDGLITANQVSATSSAVYGTVEAVSVAGSTYNGTTNQIESAKMPTMPDWASIFDYYRNNGTQLAIANLPTSLPNLARNGGIENGLNYWTGSPPSVPTANLEHKSDRKYSGTYSMKVKDRAQWYSGAAQRIDNFVRPGGQYIIDSWIFLNQGVAELFQITLVVKGSGSSLQSVAGPATLMLRDIWGRVSATLTVPTWTGSLEYAYILVAGASSTNDKDFYLDDFTVYDSTSASFIFRKVLTPTVNNLYTAAPTNPQGIYWIDCSGNRLIIERSRIQGTLLIINPGPNSCVAPGPINWSPAVAGYPALLVNADNATDANFSIRASNRALSEAEQEVNFNPAGASYDFANVLCSPTDTTANDIYPSEIRGLIAVRNAFTFQNYPLVRGQVIIGGDIANSSGELDVQYLPDSLLNPPPGFLAPYTYVRRPASARKVVQ
jgi:Tfp pilus assembly protein PilX